MSCTTIDIPPEMFHDVGKGTIVMYNKCITPDVENQLDQMAQPKTTLLSMSQKIIATFFFNVFKAFSPSST